MVAPMRTGGEVTASPYSTPENLRVVLAGLFRYRAVGRANALTMREMLRSVDLWRYDKSDDGRTVRKAIAELITIDHLPIAGDAGAGYYLVETAAERLAQCRQLGRRIRAEARRMRIFAAVAGHDVSGQGELDFSQTPEEIQREIDWVDGVLAALGDET